MIGIQVAERLGLSLPKRRGHEMAGPCIACKSSDAFSLNAQSGKAHCFSCGEGWGPYGLACQILGDRERARVLMIELGIFQPGGQDRGKAPADPIEVIARQKGITPKALLAFGASRVDPTTITLPMYGPDGVICSTFTMTTRSGDKGRNEAKKPAGLFFPHRDAKVRLPVPGETWHAVEGTKDAAALFDLDLLAWGLYTSEMNAKFARLFVGTNVILIPDRDRAGQNGAAKTAGVLQGNAKSILIATLPAEFRDSKGDDVRDVLRRHDGRTLVMQAIADARPPDWWSVPDSLEVPLPGVATPLRLEVSEPGRGFRQLVIATCGKLEFRDLVTLDSSSSRDRFFRKLAGKLGIDPEQLGAVLDPVLSKLARQTTQFAANSDAWERISEIAGLRGMPPPDATQRDFLLTFAACLANQTRREALRAMLLDVMADDLIELYKEQS